MSNFTISVEKTISVDIVVEQKDNETWTEMGERVRVNCIYGDYDHHFDVSGNVSFGNRDVHDAQASASVTPLNSKSISALENQAPEYLFSAGSVEMDRTAKEFFKQESAVENKRRIIDASWAGATFVGMLKSFPDVQKIAMTFTSSSEYNDEGGTFMARNIKVSEIVGGESKDISYVLKEQLGEDARELYVGFCDRDDDCDLEIEVVREKVSHLLDQETISGIEAFKLLFPEHLARLAL